MKQKQFLVYRSESIASSETVNANDETYRFGASFQSKQGTPLVTVVFEQTLDGGYTWAELITFTLDTDGSIELPIGHDLHVGGNAIRARVSAMSGGVAEVSAWMI